MDNVERQISVPVSVRTLLISLPVIYIFLNYNFNEDVMSMVGYCLVGACFVPTFDTDNTDGPLVAVSEGWCCIEKEEGGREGRVKYIQTLTGRECNRNCPDECREQVLCPPSMPIKLPNGQCGAADHR